MSDEKTPPNMAKDGWTPFQKGWTPKIDTPAVQGGYIPTTGQVAVPPPTGGSGVKPAPKK